MKKYLILIFTVLATLVGCGQYDDSELKSDINDLKSRMAALEKQCKNLNENLTSLQAIVDAIQKQDGIVSVTDLPEGKGYSVLFTSGKVIYLYNGTNGTGSSTPKISVRQDSDGIYYWTVDGEWLIVDGKKVRASATDGKDAVTPQFKIEDGFWYVSYDGGNSWSKLGKATGGDGKDSDGFFKSITVENGYAIFVMNDSAQTTIKIPMSKSVAVSSIRYVPKSLDGIEKVMFSKSGDNYIPEDLAVRFEVLPQSAAEYIVKNWKNILEAKIVYVGSTRAEIGVFSTMEIKNVEYDKDNIHTITIDTKSIDENFFLSKGTFRANLRLSLKLGDSEFSSDYIPVIPFPKSSIIEYSTVDGTKTSAQIYIERSGMGKIIPYNTYYFNNLGRIVFDDRDSLSCVFYDNMIKSLKFVTPIKVRYLKFGNSVSLSSALTDIDVSNVDTKNVIDMSGMFYKCQYLTSLDLSSFDTKNVTDMNSMFSNCQSLTSLNLSSFDTKNVTDMSLMFKNCQSLTSLDLSSFDTKNVTDMNYMFSSCSSLVSLDLSGFDTKNVTGMYCMFYDCNSLTSLNLSNFSISENCLVSDMFHNCTNLKEIIMRGCDKTTIEMISKEKPEGAVIITD